MRSWERRPLAVICGRCGARVPKDTPVLVIDPDTSRGIKQRFIRCQACAGEPVPETLQESA